MRKIEKQMLAAIHGRKNWISGNTAVYIEKTGNPYGVRAEVYLHGNMIAECWYSDTSADDEMRAGLFADCTCTLHGGIAVMIDIQTLRDYPTVTTKSRLRALGVDVYTKQGVTYLNGAAV